MNVLCCSDIKLAELTLLLGRFSIQLHLVEDAEKIPGSWFGDPEAGIINNNLYVRNDTPVHSAFHESCHYICMSPDRRENLHTNAGGGYDEENAVCYLSILLSEHIHLFGSERMFKDMDKWGYTFRLGSSRAWFKDDAQDAIDWLLKYNLIDENNHPNWSIRNRV